MCVCVCVCVPRTQHRDLSDTSALEIPSGGQVKIEFPSDLDRSLDFEKRSHRESMGYCQEENEKQETKKFR